jgi:hypothetical protein
MGTEIERIVITVKVQVGLGQKIPYLPKNNGQLKVN